MAADHGVCDEEVSQYPQAVTGQMILNFLNGGAAVNVLANQMLADVFCCDVGSLAELEHPNLLNKKVRPGTNNIAVERAMTVYDALQAIHVGIETVEQLHQQGYRCFATGEMGIGNTTASSALLAVCLDQSLEQIVGFGTGINDQKREHKISVVNRALQRYHQEKMDHPKQSLDHSLEWLSQLGGLEIAGLVGVIIGAARKGCPVVIDGLIATTAAVIAKSMAPSIHPYLFASHLSQEPAHRYALQYLHLEAMLHMDMRLGEGTGAVLCFPLLDAAVAIMRDMATFESAGVSQNTE